MQAPQIQAPVALHANKCSRMRADHTPKILVISETSWPPSARIVYPSAGGEPGLKQQTPELQGVLRDAMANTLLDLWLEDVFPTMGSRATIARKYLLQAAHTRSDALEIKQCLKQDLSYSAVLTDLVGVHYVFSILFSLFCHKHIFPKVAASYRFDHLEPEEIAKRVADLLDQDKYIFPVKDEKVCPHIPLDTSLVTFFIDWNIAIQSTFLPPVHQVNH